jgi:hypothetical protein
MHARYKYKPTNFNLLARDAATDPLRTYLLLKLAIDNGVVSITRDIARGFPTVYSNNI